MKILLLNPPYFVPVIREGRCQSPQDMRKTSVPQMTLAYLAGVLEKTGHVLKVYDCIASHITEDVLFEEMDRFTPELAIVNTTTPTINSDLLFMHALKKRYLGCLTAVFGTHVTVMHKEVMEDNVFIKEFMLYDDNFVMFRQNLKKLLNMLIDKKLDLTWSCNARIDMVNEEILHRMAEAGCWQISYGIETGNQKIMDLIGKNITKERVRETLCLTRKAGIRTVGYFMIGHFGETQATIDETIEFACNTDLDDFRMSFFTPLPGTKAYLMAEQYGSFENDWGKMTLFSPVFIPKGFTKESLIYNQKKAMRKFFMRPRIIRSYLAMVRKPSVALQGAYQFAKYCFNV